MMCVWCVTEPEHVGVALCVFFSVCAKYVRNFTHICTLLQDICMYVYPITYIYIEKVGGTGAAAGRIQCIYDGTLIFMACPLVIWTPISMEHAGSSSRTYYDSYFSFVQLYDDYRY